MLRFVVLRHTPGCTPTRADAGVHLDWMFESNGALRTWATELADLFAAPIELQATRLADHRLHYLEFEGELTNQRGIVDRIVSGHFQTVASAHDRFVANLEWIDSHGRQWSGDVNIYRNLTGICLSDDAWRLRFSSLGR